MTHFYQGVYASEAETLAAIQGECSRFAPKAVYVRHEFFGLTDLAWFRVFVDRSVEKGEGLFEKEEGDLDWFFARLPAKFALEGSEEESVYVPPRTRADLAETAALAKQLDGLYNKQKVAV